MGVTGPGIAETLSIPSVTIAKDVRAVDGKVHVVRVLGDAFETVDAELPALVTVSNELGEPRYPKLQQIMQAARKQVQVWTAADLGLDAARLAPRLNLERLYIPEVDSQVEWIEGESPQEMAQNLARKLREARII
jgi:electron transfer flavoprotein beta subunit